MIPTAGRFVTLRGRYAQSNGVGECPALITSVWPDDMINVVAFPDAMEPIAVTSVKLFADRDALDEYVDGFEDGDSLSVAYWPTA
ncbi:hypothetical protein ABT369_38940 [Dactylosporangium sp. NPDC000244]|uniref:hypothetical protein n=1 Tax=Dactylosporangium sp. NPDC000244 TaxID=3154365 RepID=UPI00332A4866